MATRRQSRISAAIVLALTGLATAGFASAATIVVNDASDALHSAGCAASGIGTCTLRDAITFANANAGADEIHFDIAGTGVHTITLDSDLATVAGDLTIDGYTQGGSNPNSNGPGLGDNAVLTVEVNGNGKGCFTLHGDANTVRGLVINRCGGAGVAANGFVETVSIPSVVVGNFIGVDAAGTTPLPNGQGIVVLQDDMVGLSIGDGTPGGRNVISGNAGSGISGAPFAGSSFAIHGNFIGTDATGTVALPNGGSGIEIGVPFGPFLSAEISDNVVSGNSGRGISLEETHAHVQGNLIGTDVSGTLPLGNRAMGLWIAVDGSFGGDGSGLIEDNTIAFNGIGDPIGGGIFAGSYSFHQYFSNPTIRENSIFDNTSDGSIVGRGLGILAGSTGDLPCNYPGVSEGQAPQNFPVLTSASSNASAVRIRGSLESTPTSTFRVEFFASPACDPSGFGEGKTFLGSADVTTDDSCSAPIDVILPVGVPVGEVVTATATDASTSSFSNCVPVEALLAAEVVNDLVELTSLIQERNRRPVLGGPAGTMTVRATFKNTSSTPIDAPFFEVTELSEGNLLLNADGSPSGVGAKLTANVGADKLLSPGESFTTEFVVGLHNHRRFRFFVDLWGVPIP